MAYIEDCRDKPFEWAVHDCTVFVRGACQAQLGKDLFEGHVPSYKTIKGAKSAYGRLLGKSKSYKTILDAVLTPFQGVLAPRGSIVARQTTTGAGAVLGAALGVVVSRHVAFVGEQGLEFLLADPMDEAWVLE